MRISDWSSDVCSSDLRRSAAGDAPGLHELVAPVAVDQARHHDVLAGARGMHEAAVAQVDADVVDALAAAAEEHQVAGVQCVTFDLLAAVRHLPRDARQFDAQGTAEHIADQSAAVEAVGGAAAPAVWRAEQGQRALE